MRRGTGGQAVAEDSGFILRAAGRKAPATHPTCGGRRCERKAEGTRPPVPSLGVAGGRVCSPLPTSSPLHTPGCPLRGCHSRRHGPPASLLPPPRRGRGWGGSRRARRDVQFSPFLGCDPSWVGATWWDGPSHPGFWAASWVAPRPAPCVWPRAASFPGPSSLHKFLGQHKQPRCTTEFLARLPLRSVCDLLTDKEVKDGRCLRSSGRPRRRATATRGCRGTARVLSTWDLGLSSKASCAPGTGLHAACTPSSCALRGCTGQKCLVWGLRRGRSRLAAPATGLRWAQHVLCKTASNACSVEENWPVRRREERKKQGWAGWRSPLWLAAPQASPRCFSHRRSGRTGLPSTCGFPQVTAGQTPRADSDSEFSSPFPLKE
ncbi:uncharacterized protein [Macaca fascicularis]|uniref:uncharacterized protein n=1 Tax=Macaca fascicularis TaxID=9541 RepID=UPI0032B046C3